MATTPDYINYICELLESIRNNSYKKMFGKFMINNKANYLFYMRILKNPNIYKMDFDGNKKVIYMNIWSVKYEII